VPGFYGWTARIFYVGVIQYGDGQPPPPTNTLSVAAAESIPAHDADQLRAIIRHARIHANAPRSLRPPCVATSSCI